MRPVVAKAKESTTLLSGAARSGSKVDGLPDRGQLRGWRRMLVEHARPTAIAQHPSSYWFVVATVSVGAFMGQLDASVVSLAYPTLERTFHTTLWAVQWVGLSYLLVLVSLVVAIGRVADTIGRKVLYTYGFVVFGFGSGFCGLAPSLVALDGFRAFQAVGAAMMQANSVAIIALAMPREKLGRGIGVQGAAQALGLALGPAVGGGLIAVGGWRLIFLINVPIGIVGTFAAVYLIPRSRNLPNKTRFDWFGLALLAPALIVLLFAVSFGNQLGWHSAAVVALLAATLVFTVGFIFRERRTAAALIDLRLFKRPAFSAAVTSGLLSYIVLFGALFVAPFFLEASKRLSVGRTGLILIALPAALAVVAPFAGWAADRLGARPLTAAGMLVAAIALIVLALFHGAGLVPLVGELAVLGTGLGLFIPANNASIIAGAPRAQSGMASGILNMTRGLGTSLGLALTALVFGTVVGGRGGSSQISEGFKASTLFLAAIAICAAALSTLRRCAPSLTDVDR